MVALDASEYSTFALNWTLANLISSHCDVLHLVAVAHRGKDQVGARSHAAC